MAVYTDVSFEELERFLAGYDIGAPSSFKGIAEGVENSNFYLQTDRGAFILTLYEKRVQAERPAVLPGPDGASGGARHRLPAAGAAQRRRAVRRSSTAGRPRIVTFLDRRFAAPARTPRIAPPPARRWPQLHEAGEDFALQPRQCAGRRRAGATWREAIATAPTAVEDGLRQLIDGALDELVTRLAGATCRAASSMPIFFPTMCCSWTTRCRG